MRRTLWKWHGWLGLTAALPLFIIALSGSLLVFKNELDGLLMPAVISSKGGPALDMNTLMHDAERQLNGYELLGWQPGEPGQNTLLYLSKMGSYVWQKTYIDPSTGLVTAPVKPVDHYLTDWLLSFHYTFVSGAVGIAVAGVTALLLLALSISGFILHRRFWKTFFTLRWGKSLRLFLSDGHKMLGIIGAPVFLILGFTGAWWNLDEFSHEIETHDDSAYIITQRYYNDKLDFDAILARAKTAIPGFVTTYIRLPDKSYPGIHLFGHPADAGPLRGSAGSIISFDDQTGALTGVMNAASLGALYQFKDSFKPLHFGTFGGLTTRVLWCLIGFFPCLMALSGFWMWRKRVKR
ncbi:PepSY-associated TM helix domain-containing protein [Gallaecimonas pentaromativorans]|uniref:Putative iron-regulated membrane protein n=1 Tax=Gallaecimonas pentaromativorans TaxID=584787 RepID=A0A3N1P8R8_9GAMM|nr:PepSY-associated TM helix domain-containing protein [Gallaecimonas pentaromativorans]ROQ24943.1 putative iron-regulated membrane protein [Gallaecimonas pentaromativorans]